MNGIPIGTLFSALLVSTLAVAPSRGEAPSKAAAKAPAAAQAGADADLAAIRAGSEEFARAFNAGDATALAALWARDGECTEASGERMVGREAIAAAYARYFKENPKAKIRIVIDSLRMLAGDAAMEDGTATVEASGSLSVGKYTAVHVKGDGRWLMASVRESRMETATPARNLADLDWLVGGWVGEEFGVRTESDCRWVADKSFVERRYTVTHSDGTTSSGVQLIGWNPQDGCVESWDFCSGGGYAVGMWSPHKGGWTAEVLVQRPDGTPTTAVNSLTRLDDNAYVWQSTRRTAAGQPLPDTDEVVIKRRPVSY